MTSPAKRKVSVTLDADLVEAMEADRGTTLSAEVNSLLRAEFTRRKRQRALADLLDRLADERGRLDTPEDEAEIARYMRLLGGARKNPPNSGPADAPGAASRRGDPARVLGFSRTPTRSRWPWKMAEALFRRPIPMISRGWLRRTARSS
jgi:hypothetical protein